MTVADFPISKDIAGVNMRLTAGGVRELHWHDAAEWAIMLSGSARITAIDLDKNTVSVIHGVGGAVQTYTANTPGKQELLRKAKVGDVVIGITTPLLITAIRPAK